jgi:hypothetical protein
VVLTAIAEYSGAVTITNDQFIAAASDQESDALTISNVAIASGSGALVDNGNGTWSYTPATNDEISLSFSYTITDDGTANGSSDPLPVEGTATLDITAVNNAPTDVDITATTNEDVPFNFQTDSFSFSDPIDKNNFAGLVIASLPTAGTLKLSGSSVSVGQSINSGDIRNLVFTPATNAYGTNNSSFAFKVFDHGGTSKSGHDTDQTANTWRFNVNPIDDYAVVSGDTSGSALQFKGAITGDLRRQMLRV